ncbi:tripartite motif-containing protein 5-like [Sorex araneus]|uniref:tripartite motif-containing protein 5-like n=1 Tax=Sorex araneus TaxID=42254 RepID=UPI002433967C|nr:tripartite motif-containing protein 5-like [Sorex araneus]XP_054999353.1 tripartite motif-containing protein 5-like [Sorex araneus]
MAREILRNLKEEVTCPICLELLTEPLSLDCGHSFCQACITTNSQKLNQAGENSCPVCRIIYDPGNMRPNRHLTNLVEHLRGVNLSLEEEEKKDHCEHHGEKLLLFCKEDWMLICWLCERSQEHRGHHTVLIEEAAKECKEKLQACLEELKNKQQEAEGFETALREHRTSWQNQIDKEIQSVQKAFKEVRDVLDLKEQKELQKLREEEKKILHDLAESEKELVQQSEFTRGLISDLELKLQASPKEMLHNVNDLLKRNENLTLTKPKTFPLKDRKVIQATDLSGILTAFYELKDMQRYWVQMTLKVPDNNRDITLSLDGRQVRCVANGSSQQGLSTGGCDNYVLGSESIESGKGKCYWEVDVSDKHEWMVGVRQITSIRPSQFNQQKEFLTDNFKGLSSCGFSTSLVNVPSNRSGVFENPPSLFSHKNNYPSVSRPMISTVFQTSGTPQTVSIRQHPKHEPQFDYWVIGLQNHSENKVFVNTSASNSGAVPLSMIDPPCRIGVFVDYEARTVSFFNVTNHGFLMHKFSSCSFSDKIVPYFNLRNCSGPITLCSPTS